MARMSDVEVAPSSSSLRPALLKQYGLLDAAPEAAFDRIARITADLFSVPTAVISFVDPDQQWVKAQVGFPDKTLPFNDGPSTRIVEQGTPLVVSDVEVLRDGTSEFVQIDGESVQFYAGIPLGPPHTDEVIGALSIMDTAPRHIDGEERGWIVRRLADMGAMVMNELERRREAATREQTRVHLQHVADNVSEGIYRSTPNDGLMYVNQAFADLFGYDSPEEMLHLPSIRFYRNAMQRDALLEEEHETDGLEGKAVELRRKDGSTFIGRISSTVLRDDEGNVVYYDGVVTDITESYRAQREVRRQKKILQTVVENVQSIVFLLDENGRFLVSGGRDLAALGLESGEVVGKSAFELYVDYPAIIQRLQRALQGEAVQGTFEMEGRVFDTRYSPVYSESGSFVGCVGVAQDITEHKEKERAHRRSAERWERLVEVHPDPIVVSIDDRIKYINPAGARVLGVDDSSSLTECSLSSFVDEDDKEKAANNLRRVYNERRITMPQEYTVRGRDGVSRVVEARSVPIIYNGQRAAQTIVRDITAERTLEQQLRVRNDRFQTLLKYAQPAIFLLDDDANILVAEGKHLSRLVDAPGTLAGDSFHARYADATAFTDCVDQALSGTPVDTVVEVNEATFDVWFAPIQDVDRQVSGCVGMAVDITERIEAEQALRQERDLLERIFNTSAAAITILDTEGRITEANSRAEEVLGISANEASERTYNDPDWGIERIDGTSLPEDELPFSQVMATQAPVYDIEHAIRWPDGTRKVVSINGAPLRNANEEVVGAVFTVHDITERHEQDRMLRRTQRMLDAIIDNAGIGICVTNADRKFVQINPAFSELFGWTEKDLIGASVGKIVAPEQRAQALKVHDRVIHEGIDEEPGEWKVLHKDGSKRDALVTAERVILDGEPYKVITIADITDRVAAEQALRKAKQSAESAARLKSAMLANMSHEVRTPLTSIIGFAEVLQDETHGRQSNFARHIVRSANRLLTTLNSVLRLSKLEAGTEAVETVPMDAVQLVGEIVDEMAPQAERASVSLTANMRVSSVHLESDPGALQRVLYNTLSNAIKFTPESGQVNVCVTEGPSGALIEVTDTGIGMSESFQERMFDAFTQESEGFARSYEGSGLGLTIVQKLVHQLGGRLEVESTQGYGTRISIFLPK